MGSKLSRPNPPRDVNQKKPTAASDRGWFQSLLRSRTPPPAESTQKPDFNFERTNQPNEDSPIRRPVGPAVNRAALNPVRPIGRTHATPSPAPTTVSFPDPDPQQTLVTDDDRKIIDILINMNTDYDPNNCYTDEENLKIVIDVSTIVCYLISIFENIIKYDEQSSTKIINIANDKYTDSLRLHPDNPVITFERLNQNLNELKNNSSNSGRELRNILYEIFIFTEPTIKMGGRQTRALLGLKMLHAFSLSFSIIFKALRVKFETIQGGSDEGASIGLSRLLSFVRGKLTEVGSSKNRDEADENFTGSEYGIKGIEITLGRLIIETNKLIIKADTGNVRKDVVLLLHDIFLFTSAVNITNSVAVRLPYLNDLYDFSHSFYAIFKALNLAEEIDKKRVMNNVKTSQKINYGIPLSAYDTLQFYNDRGKMLFNLFRDYQKVMVNEELKKAIINGQRPTGKNKKYELAYPNTLINKIWEGKNNNELIEYFDPTKIDELIEELTSIRRLGIDMRLGDDELREIDDLITGLNKVKKQRYGGGSKRNTQRRLSTIRKTRRNKNKSRRS